MKTKNNFSYFSLATILAVTTASGVYAETNNNPATKIPIALADEPLNAFGTSDKPAITLALSVEFPTIGALYRDPTQSPSNQAVDASYSPNNEYIGYFYSKGCYKYISNPTDEVKDDRSKDDYKRFQLEFESADRKCTGETFSGNFLNWSASSSIDILRLALSGGDRYIDETDLTVLQRAVVPSGNPQVACLWNHNMFFPAKKLTYHETHKFYGAIPEAMATRAIAEVKKADFTATQFNLWVANRHDGIYFNVYPNIIEGSSKKNPDNRGWENSCDLRTEVPSYKRFISTQTSDNTDVFNSDGFYYARVEVCSKIQNGIVSDHKDFDLCTEQPNGKFKPTGTIQKYSNNLRMAAFSYALDHSANRYGGVLRAPMRYLGIKSYDIYGREEANANPYAEWDPTTGIFKTNPHNSTSFNNSGLINYLNKFGRMGTASSNLMNSSDSATAHYYGEYKRRDPLSTLYQQALRYLQGLPPTPAASSGLSAKAYDGFPIYTDWSNLDPYGNGRKSDENYACLKSNIVTVGDVFFDGDKSFTSPDPVDSSRQKIDYKKWRNDAITYERNNFGLTNVSINGNTGAVSARPRDNPSGSSSATEDYNIVGYAYWAHAKDIRGVDWTEEASKPTTENKQRPGLRIKSFFFDVNEKGASPSNKRYNPFYLASKYGGYENNPSNFYKKPYSVTLEPNIGFDPIAPLAQITSDAIWQRQATAATGNASSTDPATYYLQSDARSVLKAFEDIFKQSADPQQSIAQAGSDSSSITGSSETHIYVATYAPNSWEGNITARKISVDKSSKNPVIDNVQDEWNPAERLLSKGHQNRNIFIGHSDRSKALEFEWGLLDSTTKSHLNKASISSDEDNLGQKRLNYLRGSRTEGTEFRNRTSILGDIIRSGVTYSGPPSNKFVDKSYQLFYKEYKNRLPVVIAGANDGMLHAFATKKSEKFEPADEVFAYIPSWLTPKLSNLTSHDYVLEGNHQSYVDAPSVVGEAQIAFTGGAGSANDWKTILVSGTGPGGRGVFALDITDPENFSSGSFIWEFTEADDLDMGYVIAAPKILKFKILDAEGEITTRWFAAVASGVNNYQSTFDNKGGSGSPSIFLLALDKPAGTPWDLNKNYFKISLPFETEIIQNVAPGIIDFSVLFNNSNDVTHIYAGDLHGNIWKLDFTSSDKTAPVKPTTQWNINGLSFFKDENDNPIPLYIAQTPGDNPTRQAISTAPLIINGPVVAGRQTFYVAIGTGKYLELSDINTASYRTESFYVLFDDNKQNLDSDNAKSAISNRSRLQAAEVNKDNKSISAPFFSWGRALSDDDRSKKSGWYFDFATSMERMINKAENIGQFNIAFNSIIPTATQNTASSCTTDSGSSHIYDVNIATGNGKYKTSSIGILGPSLFFENEEKVEVGSVDSTGRAKRKSQSTRLSIGSSGVNADEPLSVEEMIGRLSWRQIYNYKELKHKTTN